MNAMIIDPKDNVAVAIEPIAAGGAVSYLTPEGEVRLTAAEDITISREHTALEDITIYHKLATRDIAEGEAVVKYGEHIGVATAPIAKGAHVHVHNVVSPREDRQAKE